MANLLDAMQVRSLHTEQSTSRPENIFTVTPSKQAGHKQPSIWQRLGVDKQDLIKEFPEARTRTMELPNRPKSMNYFSGQSAFDDFMLTIKKLEQAHGTLPNYPNTRIDQIQIDIDRMTTNLHMKLPVQTPYVKPEMDLLAPYQSKWTSSDKLQLMLLREYFATCLPAHCAETRHVGRSRK